ncbi:hypothetical protein ACXR2T_08420 [Leucobacter sp. HY1910]
MLDAYVLGHGIPELAAALELAEVGLRVRVAPHAGPAPVSPAEAAGSLASGDGSLALGDAAAASTPDRGVRDPEGLLRALLEHVAAPIDPEKDAVTAAGFPAAAPVATPPAHTLLRGAAGSWLPLPATNVWGLPAVPMASDSIALLGGRGALRATVDRIRPVLTIGQTPKLGALVRSRMGQQMLDRVVDPLVRDRFGVAASELDVAIAAPGLNGALTTAGSLSGAVFATAEDYVARETLVAPAGGWAALRDALLERLALYGVQFGGEVVEVAPLPTAQTDAAASGGHAGEPRWRVTEEQGQAFEAAAIVVGDDGVAQDAQVKGRWRQVLTATVAGSAAGVPADLAEAAAAAFEDPSGGSGAAGIEAIEALEGPAGDWTVRYEQLAPDHWRVTAAGPAGAAGLARSEATAAQASSVDAVRRQVSALAQAQSSWRLAPWSQAAERDAAAAEIAVGRDASPWQLLVGRGVHAGDLAEAVGDAREASVQLRRRLTGIAE